MNSPSPRHTHDCDRCKFLGIDGVYDVYVCNATVLGPSYIARASSDGPDYASYPRLLLGQIPMNDPAFRAILKFLP